MFGGVSIEWSYRVERVANCSVLGADKCDGVGSCSPH